MSFRRAQSILMCALLCAAPSLASVIDFEGTPVGTIYGAPNDSPGEIVITTADGIEVSVQELLVNGSPFFFQAEVGGDHDQDFPTTPLSMDNISLLFDFASADLEVNFVSLDFQEFGGKTNFAVNGGVPVEYDPNLGGLSTIPTNVAPGVTATVDADSIILMGDLEQFLIGGQELGIDNIVMVPEPVGLVLLAFGAGAAVLRRHSTRAG